MFRTLPLCALALLTLVSPAFSQDGPRLRLVRDRDHELYLSYWPKSNDPALNALREQQLIFYNEDVMPPAYQDWDGALQLLTKSASLEFYQASKAHYIDSNPSLIMTERCHYFKKHPPGTNWDGVFTMKEK